MKHLLPLLIFLSCLNSAPAQVTLSKLTDTLYISQDDYYARENSMVYIGPEYITLIGATWTPDTARELHEAIKAITPKPVREVINTNYHPDRAGGNAYWHDIGCDIHATSKTCKLLESDWQSIVEWTRNGIPDFPKIPLSLPNKIHTTPDSLQQGSIVMLYLGPSHTEDGIFIYFPNEKVLYAGCILKSFLGNLEQADIAEYPKTLQKLKDLHLDIDTIIAGHGQAIHDASLIDHYLGLLAKAFPAAEQ